jgi:hypothetical protein
MAAEGDIVTLRYRTDPFLRIGDVLDPPVRDDFSEYRFEGLVGIVEEIGKTDELGWFARCKLRPPLDG